MSQGCMQCWVLTLTTLHMCHAGSKIRSTSILHMAWELLALLIGYKLLHIWRIHTEVELQTDSQ